MDSSNFNLTTAKAFYTPENVICPMQEESISLALPPHLKRSNPVAQLNSRKIKLQASEKPIGTLKQFQSWLNKTEYDFRHKERYNEQLHIHQNESLELPPFEWVILAIQPTGIQI